MSELAEAKHLKGAKSVGLIRDTYDNFIGGKWTAPLGGEYFDNPTPITKEEAMLYFSLLNGLRR